MKKNVILSIVLVLLVIISAIQALQLTSLKSKMADVSLNSMGDSSQKLPIASSGSPQSNGNTVAADISNLPGMVGGC